MPASPASIPAGRRNRRCGAGVRLLREGSLTHRRWYLYCIFVDPSVQRTGLGQVLERSVEDSVRQMGGERLLRETSAGRTTSAPGASTNAPASPCTGASGFLSRRRRLHHLLQDSGGDVRLTVLNLESGGSSALRPRSEGVCWPNGVRRLPGRARRLDDISTAFCRCCGRSSRGGHQGGILSPSPEGGLNSRAWPPMVCVLQSGLRVHRLGAADRRGVSLQALDLCRLPVGEGSARRLVRSSEGYKGEIGTWRASTRARRPCRRPCRCNRRRRWWTSGRRVASRGEFVSRSRARRSPTGVHANNSSQHGTDYSQAGTDGSLTREGRRTPPPLLGCDLSSNYYRRRGRCQAWFAGRNAGPVRRHCVG